MLGMVFFAIVLSLAAIGCGGSSSNDAGDSSTETPSGSTADEQAGETSGDATLVAEFLASDALTNSQGLMGNAQAGAMGVATPVKSPAAGVDCVFLDSAGNEVDFSNPQAIQTNLNSVTKMSCDRACTQGGSMVFTAEDIGGVPIFIGYPFPNGMLMNMKYTDCAVDTVCGTKTINGNAVATLTGAYSNPCDADYVLTSNDLTIDSIATLLSFNLTFDITSAGDCSTVGSFNCDDMLSDDSTLTYGSNSYSKDEICDMMDQTTCQ